MAELIFKKNGITFNATPYTKGLDDFAFSRELKDDNTVVFSVSNELTFRKKAYDYLKDSGFWNCPDPDCDAECEGIIRLKSCNKEIPFKLSAKDSIYCPSDCEITGAIELVAQDSEKRDCLKQPFVSFVFDGFNNINGFQPVRFSKAENVNDTNLNTGVVRGSRLVDLLDIITAQCGLDGWCSNILTTSPWDNLVIVHTDNSSTYNGVPFGNQPMVNNVTTRSIFDVLNDLGGECGVFYEYEARVFDGKLYFEHKDFFLTLGQAFDQSEFSTETSICFQFGDSKRCSSLKLSYEEAGSGSGEDSIDSTATNSSSFYSLNADGTLGGDICECTYKWATSAFNNTGNLVWQGSTQKPTLVIFNGDYNNATAIFEAECGYNYPLHLNNESSCPDITQTFLDTIDFNKCSVEVKDSLELCPVDMCAFIGKLLINDTFKIQTECGIITPKNVEVNVSKGLVSIDDFDNSEN